RGGTNPIPREVSPVIRGFSPSGDLRKSLYRACNTRPAESVLPAPAFSAAPALFSAQSPLDHPHYGRWDRTPSDPAGRAAVALPPVPRKIPWCVGRCTSDTFAVHRPARCRDVELLAR